MSASDDIQLKEPRFETILAPLSISGTSTHYQFDAVSGIPGQWQSFAELIPQLAPESASNQGGPGDGPVTYGVIFNSDNGGFDYLTGIESSCVTAPTGDLFELSLGEYTYAVFTHEENSAQLGITCGAIFNEWLPQSGKQMAAAPWFERYGASFVPHTGDGGLEVWIPVTN